MQQQAWEADTSAMHTSIISVPYWLHSLDADLWTSNTVVSELAGIHTAASFAEMKCTLQCQAVHSLHLTVAICGYFP